MAQAGGSGAAERVPSVRFNEIPDHTTKPTNPEMKKKMDFRRSVVDAHLRMFSEDLVTTLDGKADIPLVTPSSEYSTDDLWEARKSEVRAFPVTIALTDSEAKAENIAAFSIPLPLPPNCKLYKSKHSISLIPGFPSRATAVSDVCGEGSSSIQPVRPPSVPAPPDKELIPPPPDVPPPPSEPPQEVALVDKQRLAMGVSHSFGFNAQRANPASGNLLTAARDSSRMWALQMEALRRSTAAPVLGANGFDDTPLDNGSVSGRGMERKATDRGRKDVNRSNWTALAMKRHPEILELRERLNPLSRAVSFGRLYSVGRTEVKETLSREVTLRLIMQHLDFLGLNSAKKMVEEESGVSYENDVYDDGSRLMTLLRIAIKDTEKVFHKTVTDKHLDADDVEVLADHLADIGLHEQNDEGNDINIWQEPPNSPDNIIFADNDQTVKAASLNKLVERLTSPSDTARHDNLKFMKTFLMTYRSFTTPEKFLNKLMQRYCVPLPQGGIPEQAWMSNTLIPIQLRVCNVIKMWVENYFFDFNDKLLHTLNHFLENTVARDNRHTKLVKQLRNAIDRQMKGRTDNVAIQHKDPPPDPKVPKNIFSPTLDIMDVDEEEIARQMTILDSEIYRAIEPSELLNEAWSKSKLKHRAPHVLAMSQRFDAVSMWVTKSVVNPERLKVRVRNMSKMCRIAEHLRAMNNFHSLMAILAGLNEASANRLKFTREEVKRPLMESIEAYEKLMETDRSRKNYRETLQNINPPCVPFLGVYLTDLTFLEQGNLDMTNGKLINFAKRQLISNVIEQIRLYQQPRYNFQPVHQIATLLSFQETLSDKDREKIMNDLFNISLKNEPRNSERSDLVL